MRSVVQTALPIALGAFFAYTLCMQYTVRGISQALDRALRQRSRAEGKSMNATALEALAQGLGLADGGIPLRDLDDIAGTWVKDTTAEAAFAEQDQIDESLWK
jgi:plasmid stability protein